jgi:DNA ligase-1
MLSRFEQAQKGGLDEVIEGGVIPMLAKVAALGRRATVTLWTRTRKRIKSLPHIEKQLGEIFCKWEVGTYHLDGENYQHDYRDRFEELTSLIRPDEPRPGHEVVEYHIYDIVSPETFLNRFKTLEHVFDTTTHLKLVETHVAADEAALLSHYDFFKKQGYEGAMCRTLDTPYEHKRSSSLLKMKDFVDGEFRVVRLEEGRGKLQRHVGAFVCVTEDGVEFGAKGAMPNETLRQAWLEPEKWVGKMMTVKYFGKTADGSLRFPSALRLREVAS